VTESSWLLWEKSGSDWLDDCSEEDEGEQASARIVTVVARKKYVVRRECSIGFTLPQTLRLQMLTVKSLENEPRK
jgi:hypothetical protein